MEDGMLVKTSVIVTDAGDNAFVVSIQRKEIRVGKLIIGTQRD